MYTDKVWFSFGTSGLSIGFEVDADILKVDGYGSWRPPHKRGAWGRLTPPAGYRGRALLGVQWAKATGSKMNLMFDIAKNWLSLSILNKFWSGWLIKNSRHPPPPTPKKILKSRVLQMPFPAFSRATCISWGESRISWRRVRINFSQRR